MRILIAIPVYNNADTVGKVIEKLLAMNFDILAVNDGCTDDTASVLREFNSISVLNIPANKGKGNALREAFAWAEKKNYSHVITIDADGQHNPDEAEKIIEAIKIFPDSIILGNRDFSSKEVPFLSRLGRKSSNLAFKITTGINLEDTQSGFRAYPIAQISNLRCAKDRYDFEMEILLKATFCNIAIKEVQISVLYNKKTKNNSHFKPVRDTLKIAQLYSNTLSVSLKKFLRIL